MPSRKQSTPKARTNRTKYMSDEAFADHKEALDTGAQVANQTAFTARDESGRRANLDYRCRHLADRVDCI